MSPLPRKQAREEKDERGAGAGSKGAKNQQRKGLARNSCSKSTGKQPAAVRPPPIQTEEDPFANAKVDETPPVEHVLIKEMNTSGVFSTSAYLAASDETGNQSSVVSALDICNESNHLITVHPRGSHYVLINESEDPMIVEIKTRTEKSFKFSCPNGEPSDLQTQHKKARHCQWSPDGRRLVVFFYRETPDLPNIWIGAFDESSASMNALGIITYGRLLNNQWPYFKFTTDSKWAICCSREKIQIFGTTDDELDLIRPVSEVEYPAGKGHTLCNVFLCPRVDNGLLRIWFQATEKALVDTTHPETRMMLHLMTFDVKLNTIKYPEKCAIGPSDRVEISWNSTASHALVTKHCVVDLEKGNYGGTTDLHVLAANGSTFSRCNKEMVCDAQWNPANPSEFIMIEGRAKNEISMKTVKANTGRAELTFAFPAGYKNTIRYGPFGNMVLLGGYGQMAGDTAIWAKETGSKWIPIAEWREECSVLVRWSPSGRHLLMASTHPRMKVDNRCRVFTHGGKLVTQYKAKIMLDAHWLGAEDSFTTPPMPKPAASAGAARQAYRPKGLVKDKTDGQPESSVSVSASQLDALPKPLRPRNLGSNNATMTANKHPTLGPRPEDPEKAIAWDKKVQKLKEVDDASTWRKRGKGIENKVTDIPEQTTSSPRDDSGKLQNAETSEAISQPAPANSAPSAEPAPQATTSGPVRFQHDESNTTRPSIGQQLSHEAQLLQHNAAHMNSNAQQARIQQIQRAAQLRTQHQQQLAAAYQQQFQQLAAGHIPVTNEQYIRVMQTGDQRMIEEMRQRMLVQRQLEVAQQQHAMHQAAAQAMQQAANQQSRPMPMHPQNYAEQQRLFEGSQSLLQEKEKACMYGAGMKADAATLKLRTNNEMSYINSLVNPLVDDCWYYEDPAGLIQGPFALQTMRHWNKNKYFTPRLKIKCMPHMKLIELETFFGEAAAHKIEYFTEESVLLALPSLKFAQYFQLPPFRSSRQSEM